MKFPIYICAIALTCWLGGTLSAQCPTPNPSSDELNVVWGGGARAVESRLVDGARRIIVGEDGGRIRRSANDGTSWSYSVVPSDYANTVLDIEFLNDSRGFAAGRGGQILSTTDGGKNWSYWGSLVLDPCKDGATIWSIQPMSENVMFAQGLWLSRYTVDGGANWYNFELHDQGATYNGAIIDEGELHVYSIDIAGTLGNFRGLMAAEWEHPSGQRRGIVFYTDASDPNSSLGRKWRVTLDDETFPNPLPGGDNMEEPWAVEYERGSVGNNTSIAYVFGGAGAGEGGRGYRTNDSGLTWTNVWAGAPTPYDVSVEPNGRVMVASYSGIYLKLNAAGTAFDEGTLPGPPGGDITPNFTKAALGAIDSSDGQNFVVAGGFGVCQKTSDYGVSWAEGSPRYSMDVEENRLGDVFADRTNSQTAWAAGQFGRIMKTTDGGCTWTSQNYDVTAGGLRAIAFRNADRGIAVGASVSGSTLAPIYFTTNGGTTWNPGNVLLGNLVGVTLTDVAMQGTTEAWAVGYRGNNARIYYTRDHGLNWFQLTAPAQSRLQLEGVVWPDQTRGIVVGWSQASLNSDSIARAYVADFNPTDGTIVWTPVHPSHPTINPNTGSPNGLALPLRQKLLAIDASDGSAANATIYAVGNGGMVLQWNDSTNQFDDVPAVYDVDANGNLSGTGRELTIDLSAVGVSPDGAHCLIGGQYDIGIFKYADLGFGLRLDGTGWSRVTMKMGKSAVGISLSAAGNGFVAGQTDTVKGGIGPDGERLASCLGYSTNDQGSASFDHGNLADSVILRYLSGN